MAGGLTGALSCTRMCRQVLAASQSPLQKKWFQGTADAVRQYLWLFENSMREGVEDFLILAGAPPATCPTLPHHAIQRPTQHHVVHSRGVCRLRLCKACLENYCLMPVM